MSDSVTTSFSKDFTRDFQIGDTGEDVAKIQKMLMFLGFEPSEEDIEKKRFGESTLAAAERMRDAFAQNPIMGFFASLIMQFVFGESPEEAAPELRRGASKPIRNYRSDSAPQLQSIEAISLGNRGAPAAAELASRFIGQRETGENAGPVVKHFNGSEGLPWCGGFVNYVMDHGVSAKLFDQPDFLRARSFEDEAAKHNAFRKSGAAYTPHVGDVVVFTRGKGQGHVGIVTDVAADGSVTYVSGNDGNAVRARSFDSKNPPQSLIGYADTQALAAAKGITLDTNVAMGSVSASRVAAVARHSDASFARG